ncbi:MAG: hypothetical protein WEA61_01885 [Anaerolineales bacterium]
MATRHSTPALLAVGLLLAACSPAAPGQEDLATAVAELAAPITQTAAALPSSTPNPTATSTPSSPPTPLAEQIQLTGPHADGVYQVGVSIAPGLWRSIPQHQDRFCYWARRKYDGIILGSHYGPPGGEILIRPADYEVEFDGCGVWVYMGER